jgi:hypothetical protein
MPSPKGARQNHTCPNCDKSGFVSAFRICVHIKEGKCTKTFIPQDWLAARKSEGVIRDCPHCRQPRSNISFNIHAKACEAASDTNQLPYDLERAANRVRNHPTGASPSVESFKFLDEEVHLDFLQSLPLIYTLLPNKGVHPIFKASMNVIYSLIYKWIEGGKCQEDSVVNDRIIKLYFLYPWFCLYKYKLKKGETRNKDMSTRMQNFAAGKWEDQYEAMLVAVEGQRSKTKHGKKSRFGVSKPESKGQRALNKLMKGVSKSRVVRDLTSESLAPPNDNTFNIMSKMFEVSEIVKPPVLGDPQVDEDLFSLRGADPEEGVPNTTYGDYRTNPIFKALVNASSDSAAGLSGWRMDHWKILLLEKEEGADQTKCMYYPNKDFEYMYHFLSKIAHGRVPDSWKLFLSANLLLPFEKPAKPGEPLAIRPISIGDILRRWIGAALNITFKSKIRAFCDPYQYAVAMGFGMDAIVHVLRAVMLDKDVLILSTDIINAFNSMSREHIFEQVMLHFPELAGFLNVFYPGGEINRYQMSPDRSEDIYSWIGVVQGCPLGSLLFAIGFQTVLVKLAEKGVSPMSFADDAYIVVVPEVDEKGDTNAVAVNNVPEAACDAFNFFVDECAKINLAVHTGTEQRASKSSGYYAKDFPNTRSLSFPAKFEFSKEGIVAVNIPIGTDSFVHDKLEAVLAKFIPRLDAIQYIAKLEYGRQSALQLLQLCCSSRFVHWLRLCPPHQIDAAAAAFNKAILFNFESLFLELSPNAKKQIRLPIALGGLGLGDASYTSAGAYYSSATDACALLFQGEGPLGAFPLLCVHISKWRNSSQLIDVHKTVAERFVVDPAIRKFGGMPQSITPFPDHDHFLGDETVAQSGSTFNAVRVFLRESYNHSQYARFLNDLNQNSDAEDRMRMAVLRSATGAESGAWLRASVMYLPNRISNRHMTILLQLRLVMSFPEIKSDTRACPFTSSNGVVCGQHCDEMGVHLRHCKYSQGNYPSFIHNIMVNVLAELEKAAGYHARVEPRGFMNGERRPDIASSQSSHVENRLVSHSKTELIDFTCPDPRTPSNMNGEPHSYAITGAAASRAETRKHNEADDSINEYFGVSTNFKPLAIEIYGHASKAAQKHIVDRAKKVSEANGAPAHIVLAHWRIRISMALAKAVARAYDSLFMQLSGYTEATEFVRRDEEPEHVAPQLPPPNLHSCQYCGDKYDIHNFLGTHEQQCRANMHRTGEVDGSYVPSGESRTLIFNSDYLSEQTAVVAAWRRDRGASPIEMFGDGPDSNTNFDQVPPRDPVEIVAATHPHHYRVRGAEPRLNASAEDSRPTRVRSVGASSSPNNRISRGSTLGSERAVSLNGPMGNYSLDSDGYYGSNGAGAIALAARNLGPAISQHHPSNGEGNCNINVNSSYYPILDSSSSSISRSRRSALNEYNIRPNMGNFFRRSAASYMHNPDDFPFNNPLR